MQMACDRLLCAFMFVLAVARHNAPRSNKAPRSCAPVICDESRSEPRKCTMCKRCRPHVALGTHEVQAWADIMRQATIDNNTKQNSRRSTQGLQHRLLKKYCYSYCSGMVSCIRILPPVEPALCTSMCSCSVEHDRKVEAPSVAWLGANTLPAHSAEDCQQ